MLIEFAGSSPTAAVKRDFTLPLSGFFKKRRRHLQTPGEE